MTLNSNKFARTAVVAVALAISSVVVVTPLTSNAAYAQGNSGGKGNGGERGGGNNAENRSNGRVEGSQRPGRGALASELKGLNAAHASPQALANASPDSMPGKLAAFKNEYESVYDATVAFNDATAALESYPAFSTEFEEGTIEYDDALALYETDRGVLVTAVDDAEANLNEVGDGYTESYAALTGGVQLSPEAEAELLRLLGLN